MVIPPKLKPGDEIRILAPAQTLRIVSDSVIEIAMKRLNDLGFKVSFGNFVWETDNLLNNAPYTHRIKDINDAFNDQNVKCILSAIGGYSSIDVIDGIDYSVIEKNPKIFCGFSDITIIENAITSQTGLLTYYGPHFSSFGMLEGFEYTELNFMKMLSTTSLTHKIYPAQYWSDDSWFINQKDRKYIANKGFFTINEGEVCGEIIGGNITSLCTLMATKYAPDLSNKILFIEDVCEDSSTFYRTFDMKLETLLLNPTFIKVKGLVIGRLPGILPEPIKNIVKIVKNKKELNNIPVLYGVDFGHTTPILTIPIGGYCHIKCDKQNPSIEISEFPIYL